MGSTKQEAKCLIITHVFLSQFDRTKKPSVWVSDEPKPSQNGSAKDSTQNGPVIPDRSNKPPFATHTSLSKEEQSQIHSEAVAVMEKARQEQEKRIQERRSEEEKRKKELKERLEREESDKRRKEEEEEKGHQEKKKLERQKAEEEEDKENRVWEEKERRGKEQSSDTPPKSMSLDSPVPNHIVNEIKVSPLFTADHLYSLTGLIFALHNTNIRCNKSCSRDQMLPFKSSTLYLTCPYR